MLLHCCYTTVYSVTTQLKKKREYKCVFELRRKEQSWVWVPPPGIHSGAALAVRVILFPFLRQQKKKKRPLMSFPGLCIPLVSFTSIHIGPPWKRDDASRGANPHKEFLSSD